MLTGLFNFLKINDMNFKIKLNEIKFIIGEIILDLEIIIRIQNNYIKRHLNDPTSDEKNIEPEMQNRVFYNFLFLTLYKYIEFYEKYKQYINKVLTDKTAKNIYTQLMKLDIRSFRNKYIGHIIDDDTGKPISNDKIDEFFDNINKHHKSLYALYLKLDTYNFLEYPLITHLKEMKNIINNRIKLADSNNKCD